MNGATLTAKYRYYVKANQLKEYEWSNSYSHAQLLQSCNSFTIESSEGIHYGTFRYNITLEEYMAKQNIHHLPNL